MKTYFLKRLLLIPITLFFILTVNFVFIQLAPGGPVEQTIAKLEGKNTDAMARISGSAGAPPSSAVQAGKSQSKYKGAEGIDPDILKEIEKQFGFDKPMHVRFWEMLKNYAVFDLGESFYKSVSVTDLVLQKLPVSLSLGLWSTLLIYLISIPLGIKKALKDGSRFDIISSWAVIIGYAVPAFLFAIMLIIFFCGGKYLNWFPLKGLTSDNWAELSTMGKVKDYFLHLCLPVTSIVIGGFAALTMLTKNSFIDELGKPYVTTAKAKGLSKNQILYGHVFRNAMLLVISGFPAALVGILFTGSVLIEVIFSLDGLGLLGFESVMTRDYPVIFGTLYIFSLIGLVLNLVCDMVYHLVDPRIDFSNKG
jgi:microcin C transport system permease protein